MEAVACSFIEMHMKVDVDGCERIAERYEISTLPSFLLIQNHKVLFYFFSPLFYSRLPLKGVTGYVR